MESTDHICTAEGDLAAAATPRTALYARLAEEIAASIRGGTWENGDRIPSVRQFSRERGVSAATVIRAHELLEEQGYIESVPRSGHYVSDSWRGRPDATQTTPSADPLTPLDVSEIVFQLLDSIRDNKVVQFGSPFPSPELFPLAGLGHTLGLAAQRIDPWRTVEYLADGSLELRQRIA
jgi:DNA-binding transcriptional MocR family regulator